MNLSDFDYTLPPDRIALYPPETRGDSKLLILHRHSGKIEHRRYADFIEYLNPKDELILNDTRVIKARLFAQKENGREIELVVVEKHANNTDSNQTRVLYRGTLTQGERLRIGDEQLIVTELYLDGTAAIKTDRFVYEIVEDHGTMPIPPYLKRPAETDDITRYQTTFAHNPGSVAAPTASLNLTGEMLQKVNQNGVMVNFLTLHVGLGTFLPVRTEKIDEHTMHSEYFFLPAETAYAIRQAKTKHHTVMAVGTTVTRALESAASDILEEESHEPISGEADIFIVPGHRFQIVDMLLTNFHAPRSTVLLLTAAFAGWDKLQKAYDEALKKDYMFLSYGDSMLIV